MRRLLRGGFPRFEQVGTPFLELATLRPDFPDKAVCLLDISVQFDFLGGDTFILHLASRDAHVDGGYLVNDALGVAAVVDTLRASIPLQKVVGKISPCLAPQEGVVLVVPACKVNLDVYKRQGLECLYALLRAALQRGKCEERMFSLLY